MDVAAVTVNVYIVFYILSAAVFNEMAIMFLYPAAIFGETLVWAGGIFLRKNEVSKEENKEKNEKTAVQYILSGFCHHAVCGGFNLGCTHRPI